MARLGKYCLMPLLWGDGRPCIWSLFSLMYVLCAVYNVIQGQGQSSCQRNGVNRSECRRVSLVEGRQRSWYSTRFRPGKLFQEFLLLRPTALSTISRPINDHAACIESWLRSLPKRLSACILWFDIVFELRVECAGMTETELIRNPAETYAYKITVFPKTANNLIV